MAAFTIRPVRPADLASMSALYSSFVSSSTCTWAYPEEPLPDFPALWAAATARGLPWLLAEGDGGEGGSAMPPALAGYAYVGPFRARAGWRFVCEHSLYVAPAWQRRGVGRALLRALLAASAAAPVATLVGVVSLHEGTGGGAASLALHRAEGFEVAGRLPRAGVKAGLALDCVFVSRGVRDVEVVEREDRERRAAAAAASAVAQ